MNKQDLKNLKKALIEKYKNNSSEIDVLDNKINILDVNSYDKKLNDFLTWAGIPCVFNVILLPNIINISTLPLNLLQALNVSVPILIGIVGEKLSWKKINEEMKKVSSSKTYKQRIEELTRCEIDRDKLLLLNEDLSFQNFLIEEKLIDDDKDIIEKNDIDYVETQNNIQKIEENIEKKEKEINETLTKDILTSNFNKYRGTKEEAIISSIFGGICLYAACNIHLVSRVYNGKINNPFEIALPFIIGALSCGAYSMKEIKDNLDIFNKINDELGDSKLPKYSKEDKKYTEDYRYYLRLKMAELRELRTSLAREQYKLLDLDSQQDSQNRKLEEQDKNNHINKFIKELEAIKEEHGDSLVIERFEQKALQEKNPVLSWFFATKIKGADIKAHEQVIIDSKDPKYNYKFACDVKGADVRAHGQVIIDSKDLLYNYYYAFDVKGADIKAHEQVVIDSKDPEYNYYFAHNFEGADVKTHEQVVIDSKDPKYNYYFADKIERADIKAHEQVVIDSKDPEYNYYFVRDVKGADVRAHEQVIIDSKDLKYNYLYALKVKGADVRAHGQVIIDSKDLEYNYWFARKIKGADIKAHEQVVIDSKDPEYNYKFARDIEGADVRAHGQVIIDSKDLLYNYDYACDIEGADVRAHGQVIIDSKDPECNYCYAYNVKGADIKAHEQVVIDSKDLEYNYWFARKIKGADIKAHEQVVIDSKDPEYNYKFARDIEGADVKANEQVKILTKEKK